MNVKRLVFRIVCVFIFLMLPGCYNSVTIKTVPDDAEIKIEQDVYSAPAEFRFKTESKIVISRDGYVSCTLSGSDIVAEGQDVVTVELERIFHNLELHSQSTRGMILTVNGQVLSRPYQLPEGAHTLVFSKTGFLDKSIDINIMDRQSIKVVLEQLYSFTNVPSDVIGMRIQGQEYEVGQSFPIFRERSESFLPVELIKEDSVVNVWVSEYHFYSKTLDLQAILAENHRVSSSTAQNILTLTASWIDPVSQEITLPIILPPAIGFGDDNLAPQIPVDNYILREPGTEFPHVTIVNPTKELIGSTVHVTAGTETVEYPVTEESYEQMMSKIPIDFSIPDSDYFYYLNVAEYNFNVPFNTTTIDVKIMKENTVIDQVKLSAGPKSNIFTFPGSFQYHLYKGKRTSFFETPSVDPSGKSFLYIDPELSGYFLIIYKVSNYGESYIPAALFKLGIITDEPAMVQMHSEPGESYVYFVTDTPHKVSSYAVLAYESL